MENLLYYGAVNSIDKDQKNELVDKIGICASTLCLIHCLFTAIVILGLPFFNFSGFDSHLIHEIFAVVVITTVLVAVYPHCKRHGHKDIIFLGLLGIILVLSGILTHSLPKSVSEILTSIGSLFLISAHYRNMKVRHGRCSHS